MNRRIISMLVCLSLLLSMIVLPTTAQEKATSATAVPRQNLEIVAEWIHGTDVRSLGAATIVDRCAKNGITDIYLLVKGTGGKLGYNKTQYTSAISGSLDCLQAMITAGHAKGIRVHAWLCCMEDENYKTNNPNSGMWHYVRGRDNNRINPYDKGYQTYMYNITSEILSGYDVDGIHLDYIRYNHLANGWSSEDFAAMEARGVKEADVRYLLNKTFYQDQLPAGETVDSQYAFNALRNGDPTAVAVAQYRRDNIAQFANVIKKAIADSVKDVVYSAALQPEGGIKDYPNSDDWAFADLHYGQNYADAANLYDYICPMAYSPTFNKAPDWMAHITTRSMELGNEVVMGLLSSYPMLSSQLMGDIEAVRAAGAKGIVHFRHTQFGYSKTSFDLNAGEMDIHLINTYSSGYRWVKFEAAEGVTITGARYVSGCNTSAPIVIAADGSSVLMGYENETGYVMEKEGDIRLTFRGAPNGDTPIVLTRIYLTNESRAYCSFEDRTQYEVKFYDYDGTLLDTQTTTYGGCVSTTAPSRAGYEFTGWDKETCFVTGNLTVTATYQEAPTVPTTNGVPRQNLEIVAEWIHGTDVRSLGAATIVDRCAKNGITDIYLLVKGTGGKLGYNKTQYTSAISGSLDCLQAMITAGHAKGIRVHAWLCCMEDENYKTNNPNSGMWHYVRGRDNNRINPYDKGYQTYMYNITSEILSGYDVDGIHLDYIRYNHLANGWSSEDFAAMEARGVKEADVRYLLNKTFYQDQLPAGETVDSQYAFNALRNGDPTAVAVAQYRRDNIAQFANVIKKAIADSVKDVVYSAALQPEGGIKDYPNSDDWAFADLHYGQNYADAANLYDYICPMAYSPTFNKAPDWMAHITTRSMELGNEVVMGLLSSYPMLSSQLMGDIEAVRAAGAKGIVHFRHTQFGYSKTSFDLNAGEMDIHLINTYSSGYRWVKFEAAEGVTITGARYVSGCNTSAPIVIAADGSSVLMGYENETGYVMEKEGDIRLTFRGAPNGDTPIVLTRIYLTNESRAYCSFEDRTQYEVKFYDYDGTLLDTQTTTYGGCVSTTAPSRVGYEFTGWDKETCFVTGNLTVTATYKEIAPAGPTLDESIQIYHTLDLASDISITFAVPKSNLEKYDSFYMECVVPEYKGNDLIGSSTVTLLPVVSGNYYYFTLTGMTAVRMGDMVDAVLHMTKGAQKFYSKTDSYSVATYAYGMLNSSKDTKMLTLCADLLRYGAEAQTFKKYRTDALVDAALTAEQRAYQSNTEALTFTATDMTLGDTEMPFITWVGKTLDLGSKVGLKFVFNTDNYFGDPESLVMLITYTGNNGETKTMSLTGAETYNAAKNQYSFTFYGLLASELRTAVDVAIYADGLQLTETLRYSAESYAAKSGTTALAALTKALFAYSDSAKAYFNK